MNIGIFCQRAGKQIALASSNWRDVFGRTLTRSSENNISLLAGGVAFFALLAIAPTLAAIALSYGLFVNPDTVSAHITALAGNLPQDTAALISDQLSNVASGSESKKGLSLAVALAIALYGATKATSAIIASLSMTYGVRETRGFVHHYSTIFTITGIGVFAAILVLSSTAAIAFFVAFSAPISPVADTLLGVFSAALLTVMAANLGALLYRFGPNRRKVAWRWVTPGSIAAAILWIGMTTSFGVYAANIGKFGATYGSLGSVIGLLTWLYLSAYLLLMGAELNCELERRDKLQRMNAAIVGRALNLTELVDES